MKTTQLLRSTAILAFGSGCAFGTVTTSLIETPNTTDWSASFGGGNLTATSTPSTFTSHVNAGISATGDVIQSFKGNGEKLEGFGLYAIPAAATLTVWLIDYGTNVDRIDIAAEFNSKGTDHALFSDSFSLNAAPSGRQVYLDFSGASSLVLDATHHYAFVFEATSITGTVFLDRSGNDTYLDGAARAGTVGAATSAWNALGGGPRSLNFGLYTTAAIPEPSTGAALAGLAGLGVVLWRRHQRKL